MLKIAVVILNYNGKHWLEKFLPNVIENTTYSNSEIIVADNAYPDDSIIYLKTNFPAVKINGTAVSGKKFAISTVSAASLNSYEVEESTSSAGTISLRPFSVNMISF
ncbi:MAG: hypothetical protein K1X26_11885 [Chitinophagales bacterium]|nr:hypothetical protein [Chitinophagales bacterium]